MITDCLYVKVVNTMTMYTFDCHNTTSHYFEKPSFWKDIGSHLLCIAKISQESQRADGTGEDGFHPYSLLLDPNLPLKNYNAKHPLNQSINQLNIY